MYWLMEASSAIGLQMVTALLTHGLGLEPLRLSNALSLKNLKSHKNLKNRPSQKVNPTQSMKHKIL
jgi:hypothetical protein